MASADPFQEHFQCSICLEVFHDPVSTPCGHNFCQRCIAAYWAAGRAKQCPLCLEVFSGAPGLRVNTEFRTLLELFKKPAPPESSEVPCDLCAGGKGQAVKSCLICLASYCQSHLEPHHMAGALRWHTLVRPVRSLESRACRQHGKLKELFCRSEQLCVCAACAAAADHRGHRVVPAEEELRERKQQLLRLKRRVDRSADEKAAAAEGLLGDARLRRQRVDRLKAAAAESLEALTALMEARKAELLERLEEAQKAAEEEAHEVVGRLQLEVGEDRSVCAQLQELLEAEDNFRLLQGLPAVATATSPPSFRLRAQSLPQTEAVKVAVRRTEEALREQMDDIFKTFFPAAEEDPGTEQEFDDELGRVQTEHAATVTLDPNTAHPCLLVSDDRRCVRDSGAKRKVPESSSRFDCLHYVLGAEGFSSGSIYFQVSLRGQTSWEVGVAREPISRKGLSLSLSPEHGCWTLGSYWGHCQANTNPPLALPAAPETLGVLLDLQQRAVSFYDVDSRALIHSFKDCAFEAETSAPAPEAPTPLWYWSKPRRQRVYTGSTPKTLIYPLFRPSSEKSGEPLRICAV